MTSTHPELQNWAGGTYFEAKKIDRNELQIRKNSQKGTGTNMAEKLNTFEKNLKTHLSPYPSPLDF